MSQPVERKLDKLRNQLGFSKRHISASGAVAPALRAPSTSGSTNAPSSTLAISLPLETPHQFATSQSSLWEKAFELLPVEDRQGLDLTADKLTLLNDIIRETQAKRQHCIEKQWKVETVKGKTLVMRDIADRIVIWVDKFKDIGDVVVSFDPVHAALPWAGVRLLLQIAIGDSKNMAALLLGVERIVHCLARCRVYERLYLDAKTLLPKLPASRLLQDSLVALYSKILEFLAKANIAYNRKTAERIATSILGSSEADEIMGAIEKYQATVWNDAQAADAEASHIARQNLSDSYKVDHSYLKSILASMDNTVQNIDTKVQEIHDGLESEKRLKILMWLSESKYGQHHLSAKEKRLLGTGQWLLAKEEYICWRDSKQSSILWLHGIPGSGKTNLVSLVIDTLGEARGTTEAMAYFYCKRTTNEIDRQDPTAIFRAIVKQLACASVGKPLNEAIIKKYSEREMDGFSEGELDFNSCQDLVLELSKSYSRSTIVLDALDESDSSGGQRHKLISALTKIVKESSSVVRIFVSSRQDDDIVVRLQNESNLCINASDSADDIERLVISEVDRCVEEKILLGGRVSSTLKENIIKTLTYMANGMFLWVDLQLKYLCSMASAYDVRTNLGQLPKSLQETYRLIWNDQILSENGHGPEMAKSAFMIIMCAVRPLAPEEVAGLVEQACFKSIVPNMTESPLDITAILKVSHNFLAIDHQQKIVQFAHLSVLEYLERNQFDKEYANAFAAKQCLSSLLNESKRIRLRHDHGVPYIGYTISSWPIHILRCVHNQATFADVIESFLFDSNGAAYLYWYQRRNAKVFHHHPREARAYMASWLLESYPPSPMLGASLYGITTIDSSRWKAAISEKNTGGQTMLSLAARHGHLDVVKVLLSIPGIDVNVKDNDGRTPLWLALTAAAFSDYTKQIQLVSLLLNTPGVDLHSKNSGNVTTLARAAQWGYAEAVKRLLTTEGVEVNCEDSNKRTALWKAAFYGRTDVLKIFLETPDVEPAHPHVLQSLISEVLKSGNSTVATLDLLINTFHFDVNGRDNNGRTPLHSIALNRYNNTNSVSKRQFIMSVPGIDVNAKERGKDEWTPLHCTAYSGNTEMAELLLAAPGIEVNLKDKKGNTAFSKAVQYSELAMTKLLMATPNVNLTTKNNIGITPLMFASAPAPIDNDNEEKGRSCVAILKLLLSVQEILEQLNEGDDDTGATALIWAVKDRHPGGINLAMVESLLATPGLNVNQKDRTGRAVLSWAVRRTRSKNVSFEVVKAILARPGLEINTSDENGVTPLMAAVSAVLHDRSQDVVTALLSTPGIDIDCKNNQGQTALALANVRRVNVFAREEDQQILDQFREGIVELLSRRSFKQRIS